MVEERSQENATAISVANESQQKKIEALEKKSIIIFPGVSNLRRKQEPRTKGIRTVGPIEEPFLKHSKSAV